MDNTELQSRRLAEKIVFFLLVMGLQGEAYAFDWVFRPTLSLREVLSDNIRQDDTDKKTAWVTEVSPGFSLRSISSINTFNLNYRLQNLYNAGGDGGLDINHQLSLNSKYQLVRNRLYIDTQSSISQQNTSNRRIVSDNLAGRGSTTVTTFSIAPYWTPHFKHYANGLVRVAYNRVSTTGGQSNLSDTNSYSQHIRLNSGRYFSRVQWFVDFNNQQNQRSDSEDVNFQSSAAQINVFFTRFLSGFVRAGHSSNQFQSTTDSNKNGIYYTAGLQWRPSLRFSVQAGYGNNKFVTVNIMPMRRITWSTTYSNNDIGTNRGSRWQSSLRYYTRRSNWLFRYSEDTVTTQQILLGQQATLLQTGNNNPVLFRRDLPTLTDEVFINKRADLSVSFRTGRSQLSFNGYRSRRVFQVSQGTETVLGASAGWNWRFSRRAQSNIRLLWQQTDGQDGTSDKRFEGVLGITRNIVNFAGSRSVNGRVEYRYVNQRSDLATNQFTENRISASLFMQF
jgi:uncharacterized protein (PEP-CTERM system associated)